MEDEDTASGTALNNAATERNETGGSSDTTCHLLALAGELRNHIYDYVVQEDEIPLRKWVRPVYTSPLAYTCRQIRREYLPILAAKYTSIQTGVGYGYGCFDYIDNHVRLVTEQRRGSALPPFDTIHHMRIGLRAGSVRGYDRRSYLITWLERRVSSGNRVRVHPTAEVGA
ncbi:hypothetical protein LTR09_002811 [Extremus antarcticus]|uniref:Uncharacterized protein n=1 Tax=Extremus antarcticus TaxID=702011 RepID=A0AAJ0GF69_9PEZI|nr:hypothetical protein LTR09_002811 [Extremus antarcticus]